MKKVSTQSLGSLMPVLFICLSFLLIDFYCEAEGINYTNETTRTTKATSSEDHTGYEKKTPRVRIAVNDVEGPVFSPTEFEDIDFGESWIGPNGSKWPYGFPVIENIGTEPLIISAILSSNSVFKPLVNSGEDIVIAPGSNMYIYVAFTPRSFGEMTGKITYLTNDPDHSAVTINVKGTGIPSPFNLTTFRQKLLTNQQASQTLVITNHTTEFAEYYFYEVGSDFFTTDFTGESFSLNPGESKEIQIQFNSSGLSEGVSEGNIYIATAPNHDLFLYLTVQLEVVRSGPIISISDELDFFDVWIGSTNYPDFIYLTNEGLEPLVVSRISGTNSDFRIDSFPPEGVVIEPNGFFDLAVSFYPSHLGEITGEIIIESNDPINPIATINAKGVGVTSPFNRTSFQQTLSIGQQANQTLVITNDTEEFVEYNFYAFGDFFTTNYNDTNIIPLNPGEAKEIEIQFNSLGIAAGRYEGNVYVYTAMSNTFMFQWMPVQLDVINDGPIISTSHNPTGFDFGKIWVGGWQWPSCLYVENTGSEPLVISSIVSTNPDFYFDNIPPGETITIQPSTNGDSEQYISCGRFTPTSVGDIYGELIITSNDLINPILRIPLKGVGLPAPVVETSLNDTLFVNQKSKHILTLQNNTAESVEYDFFLGYAEGYFVKEFWQTISLLPGESREVEVEFDSQNLALGTYEGIIHVYGDNGNLMFHIPITLNVKGIIQDFSLTHFRSGAVVSNFNDMITLDVADPDIEKYTIRANVVSEEVSSIQFVLDGHVVNIDNSSPYIINHWTLPVLSAGYHTISAQAFSRNNARGDAFEIKQASIYVINSSAITEFNIVTSDGDIVSTLSEGDAINIGDPQFSNLNIVANSSIGSIRSVKFSLNGTTARIDNAAPYAVSGSANGYEIPWNIKPGLYTLTATPYMKYYAWGPAGTPLTVHFTIINETPSATNARLTSGNTSFNKEETLVKNAEIKRRTIVYPNPVDDEVHVILNGIDEGDFALKIMSTNGQVLYHFSGNATYISEHIIQLNQLGLTSGVYYLEVTDSKGYHEVKKLMKR